MSNNHHPEISVVCPECGTAHNYIPYAGFQPKTDGLTSVNVPTNAVCEHSFQILIDKNYNVRGYSKPDFEILTESQTSKKRADLPLTGIIRNLNDKDSILLFEALFTFTPTIIVGIYNDYKPQLAQLYHDLFPNSEQFVTLLDIEEYNRIWKNRIYSSEYIDSVVIDAMKGNVIKSNINKIKLGGTIWADLKKEKSDSVRKVILKNWVTRITKYMEVTEKLIMKQPGIKKKDIIKHLTRLHDYNQKIVPFEVIIQRLMHIDDSTFRPYLK